MSTTLDLLSATDLHGTVDGYRAGCRSSACSSTITCRDVWTRYDGDYAFRKRVDAGWHPAAIVAQEAADAEAEHARALAAARSERARSAAVNRPPRQPRAPRSAPKRDRDAEHAATQRRREFRADITRLHGEGLTDQEIADKLSEDGDRIGRERVGHLRRRMGLPCNPARTPSPRPVGVRAAREARLRDLHAAGLTDPRIAAELGISREAVRKARLKLELPLNRPAVTR